MNDQLHDDLVSATEGLTPTDMHDKVLARSHRLGVRRGLLSGGLAVAVIGALGGTGFAVLPGDDPGGMPAADGGSDAGETRELTPGFPSSLLPDDIPGSVIYRGGDDSSKVIGDFGADGQGASHGVAEPGDDRPFLAMSFDASLVSSLGDDGLTVTDLADDEPLTIPDPDATDTDQHWVNHACGEPVWSPTGSQLAYVADHVDDGGTIEQELHIADFDTAELVASFPAEGCDYQWAADGKKLMYQAEPGFEELAIIDLKGTELDTVTVDAPYGLNVDLTSVSVNAEQGCVRYREASEEKPNGAPADCSAIVD
ncbi:MAG: TolB family protein, partial [Stackebrandtia sp.]